MKILNFLTGNVVEKRNSPINGKIQVIKRGGDYRLEVGGLLQSGGMVKKIWQVGLKKINHEVKNCLILGLGGGTTAQLVAGKWPKAKITGIEIDPVMIDLAKKYFALDQIPNLEIIQADAFSWLPGYIMYKRYIRYTQVIVDLYVGDKFPKEAEGEEFLKNLKKVLTASGTIIFNRLFWGEKKKEAKNFVKKLEKHFPKISLKRTPCNLLIFCLI